jgi:hypothetical protein
MSWAAVLSYFSFWLPPVYWDLMVFVLLFFFARDLLLLSIKKGTWFLTVYAPVSTRNHQSSEKKVLGFVRVCVYVPIGLVWLTTCVHVDARYCMRHARGTRLQIATRSRQQCDVLLPPWANCGRGKGVLTLFG